MENHHLHLQDKETQSPHPTSPHSTTSSSSNNGVTAAAAPTVARSIDANPYPTTFIQADTSSFKQVVQMLTGSAETAAKHVASGEAPPRNPPPPLPKFPTGPKKPAFKLYERRGSLKNLKMIGPPMPALFRSHPGSPMRKQPAETLSPSVLDLPSLALSPVTPLIPDPFNRPPRPSRAAAMSAEDRAIADKGFYLHPSPRTTAPRLLPLFPVTSPRVSPASAAASST